MKSLDAFSKNLNKKQRVIVGIAVPLIIFVITLAIANKIGGRFGGHPFAIEDTWYIWVIFISIIGYFEFKIWG